MGHPVQLHHGQASISVYVILFFFNQLPSLPQGPSDIAHAPDSAAFDSSALGAQASDTAGVKESIRAQIIDQAPCMMFAIAGDGSRVIYQNDLSRAYLGDLVDRTQASPGWNAGEMPITRGFEVLHELFSMQGLDALQVGGPGERMNVEGRKGSVPSSWSMYCCLLPARGTTCQLHGHASNLKQTHWGMHAPGVSEAFSLNTKLARGS